MVIPGQIKLILAAGGEQNTWSFWHEDEMQFPPFLEWKILPRVMTGIKILQGSIKFWLQELQLLLVSQFNLLYNSK